MSPDQRCICGHHATSHIIDSSMEESICCVRTCDCQNLHLWEVTLQDPYGKNHVTTDVQKFVRENSDLFEWSDLEMKMSPSSENKGDAWCNAYRGLHALIHDRTQESWKGWSVLTFPKSFY